MVDARQRHVLVMCWSCVKDGGMVVWCVRETIGYQVRNEIRPYRQHRLTYGHSFVSVHFRCGVVAFCSRGKLLTPCSWVDALLRFLQSLH